MTPPSTWSALPDALAELKTRRRAGELAILRRALSAFPREADPRALKLVIPHVRPWRDAQDAGLLTAGLWAAWHTGFHAPVSGTANLGRALARLPDPRERERLIGPLITAAQPAPLRRHLSAAVGALAARSVAPDWPRLHADVYQLLCGPADPVRRSWLTGLYAPERAEAEED